MLQFSIFPWIHTFCIMILKLFPLMVGVYFLIPWIWAGLVTYFGQYNVVEARVCSELRPWEPLHGPLEPLCCCVNRLVTDNMLVPGMAAMTVNSQTTTRYVSDTISNQPFPSRLQVTTDRWLSPAKFSRAWPRWAELPSRHIARWVKRNAYNFSNHWVWHYFFYSNG